MRILFPFIFIRIKATPQTVRHPRTVAALGERNSSRTHAQTRLSGCGHNCRWTALAHSGPNYGRRQPWLDSTAV